jgi:hypothetical protein
VTENEDWTERYRPSVQAEVRAREVGCEQRLRTEESYRRGQIALRARNEIVLAEYRQVLATRISQAYQKLVAAGCPGVREMGPRKKFRAPSHGWQIRRYDEILDGILTDGTSPQWVPGGKDGKYRMRTIAEMAADALRPGYKIDGRMGWDETPTYRNRLDESTVELRKWAERIIDTWSAALVELLARNHLLDG